MKKINATLALSALLLTAAVPASAQPHSGARQGASAAGRTQSQASCMSDQGTQSRENCLKERAAASQAARRGNLTRRDDETYMKNRMQRCSALPVADRDACMARMENPTDTSGSVGSGGVLYEYKETVPAGAPGRNVVPATRVEPAAEITPSGKVIPGVVVETPVRPIRSRTMKPAR